MDEESAIVTGALSRVLRVMRAFGVAPLRFSQRHTVTVVRLWTERLWYGYLLATVLNIMIVTVTVITLLEKIQTGNGASLVGRIIMIISIINSLWLVSIAAYGAHRRMKSLLLLLRQLHKITIFFPKESTIVKDKKRTRETTTILVVVLLVGVQSFGISLFNCLCCNPTLRDVWVTLLFNANLVQIVIVSVLAVQTVVVMRLMQKAVSSYNFELKRLLDVISKGHRKEAELLKLEECMWRLSRYYLAFCENVRIMIGTEGPMMLQMIIFFVVQLMNHLFRIVVSFRELGIDNKMRTPSYLLHIVIILHLYWTILQVIILWQLSNACDKIHEKVQKMRALVSEVMYRGREIGDTFSTATGALCQQMLMHQPNFKPLSVCAVNRSLFVTVISGVITYLVTVIKFYTMEATATSSN